VFTQISRAGRDDVGRDHAVETLRYAKIAARLGYDAQQVIPAVLLGDAAEADGSSAITA